jgi:uncharacterized protein with FMN-binding domain
MIPKRGAIALLLTAAGLALLLTFKTPQAPSTIALSANVAPAPSSDTGITVGVSNGNATEPSSGGATATQGTSSGSRSATPGTTSATAASGTYTGSAIQTRYGIVQVQVTVSSGKITNVQMLQYPSSDPHSSQISQYALPTLIQEALQAQSAQVNAVSGATYTSQGFVQSLQSAILQANA